MRVFIVVKILATEHTEDTDKSYLSSQKLCQENLVFSAGMKFSRI